MQFSEISELAQFCKPQSCPLINLTTKSTPTFIPIRTLQDLNLFSLEDLFDNSLQPDPYFTQMKPINLGTSNEKTEDILQEIQGIVERSELKPLENLIKSRSHGDFIENDPENREFFQKMPYPDMELNSAGKNNQLKMNRAASEDLVLATGFKDNVIEKVEDNEVIDHPFLEKSNSTEEKDENSEDGSNGKRDRSLKPKDYKKRYSYCWIEDETKKKFHKLVVDAAQPKAKSLLSEQFHHMPINRKLSKLNRFSTNDVNRNNNCRPISVYFFGTPLCLKIPININNTVQEAVVSIICFYMNSHVVDHSLMQYPWFPEAYELRILEDDDDFHPEMSFDPLEKTKRFGEYGIESVAFCEIEGFKLTGDMESSQDKEIKEKEDQFKLIIKADQLLIQISIPQQNYSTLTPIDSNKLVKDIFPIVKKKVKFDAKKYNVYAEIGPSDEDGVYLAEDQEVDINMPLINLKKTRLKLIKKTFADEGEVISSNAILRNVEPDNINDDGYCPGSMILNEIQASKYEEFELYKLNFTKNKRNRRILGISQFRIYQKNKEIQSNIYIYYYYNDIFVF